ncbi:MAG TPA: DUF1428 domain-containing protein [Candidatus Nanoarchaeia archaeon]|nr:DUF1428 domain-containing protein [Candidatus Nanoarchaeia archaeon]
MEKYIDGFVFCVPRKKLKDYRKMAEYGGKMWKKYGALEYMECVQDDLKVMHGMLAFPKLAKPKKGELIMFSFIVYKSRAHRDSVNKKVMNDPKMKKDMEKMVMPFDTKRMSYAGFKSIVSM